MTRALRCVVKFAIALLLVTAPTLAGAPGAEGDMYVISDCNEDVRQFDGPTGDGVGVFVPNGSGGLDSPRGITFGPNGNLFVGSWDTDSIIEFDGATGAAIGPFASGGGLDGPSMLTFGPDGNLYVSSNNTNEVIKYDGTTGTSLGVFASGGGLQRPRGLVFGPNGNLLVNSQDTDQVLEFDGLTGAPLGVFASGGELNDPDGLTVGPNDNLFVASYGSHNIIEYDGMTGALMGTFASEKLKRPLNVAFGPDGSLYVVAQSIDANMLQYNGATGEFLRTLDGFCNPQSVAIKPFSGPFPQPIVSDFIPFAASNCGWLRSDYVQGAGLVWGAKVTLVRAGEPDILGAIIATSSDDSHLTAWFDLLGAATGSWDLTLRYPDAQSATLITALDVFACPPPEVNAIDPPQIVNCGALTDASVTGTGIIDDDPRIEVHLSLAGQDDIPGTNVSVSVGEIDADFGTFGAAVGFWDVVVTNPDGQTGVLPGGFEISPCGPPVVTSVVATSVIDGAFTFDIDGANFFPSDPLPTVTFRRDGHSDVVGQAKKSDYAPLKVSVDLGPLSQTTAHEVIVTRSDGQSGSLPGVMAPRDRQLRITDLGAWGGRVIDIAVDGDTMYFSSGGRLVTADISDPANPVELSSISMRNTIWALEVRNSVLFVGGDRNTVCFRTFDVSDPANPIEMWKGCGFFGGSPRDIVFWNDIAYTLHGNDAHAFDMTDPANPIVHQGVQYSLGGPTAVAGDYLFMSTDAPGNGVAKLVVFDLGNAPDPYRPPIVGEVSLGGGLDAGSIVISGNHAYIQPYDGYATPGGGSTFIIDIANPSDPVVVGAIPGTQPPSYPVSGHLAVANGILYAAVQPSGVNLYNIGANPTSPPLIGTIPSIGNVNLVNVVGDRAFIADESEGVVIYDVSNPASPVRLGGVHSPTWLRKAQLRDNMLFVTDRDYGLSIIDVSDSKNIPMQPVGIHQAGGSEAWGIDIQGNRAYLGAGTGGLEVIDVSTQSAPALLGQIDPSPWTNFDDLVVNDGIAYVGASFSSGGCSAYLVTMDVSNPENISLLDSVYLSGACRVRNVDLDANEVGVLVHVTLESNAVAIIDATDPGRLGVLSVDTIPDTENRDGVMRQSGKLRFVITRDSNDGVYAVDVRNPVDPTQIGVVHELAGGGHITVAGNKAYTSRGVVDVSDPARPLTIALWQNFHYDSGFDSLVNGPIIFGIAGTAQVGGSGGVTLNLVSRRGDTDADGDLDLCDFAAVQKCFGGSGVAVQEALCLIADFDDDNDVDLDDLAGFVGELIGPDPPPDGPLGACCLPDGGCTENVEEPYCTWTLDGMFIGDAGTCGVASCPATGACCIPYGNQTCDERTEFACTAYGGSYEGDGTDCATSSCPIGACCDPVDGSCTDRNGTQCDLNGGTYLGDGSDCATSACPFGQYSNEVDPLTALTPHLSSGAGRFIADDLTLEGTGARDLVYYNLAVGSNVLGSGTFGVTVGLYTDCPGNGGTVIPGTTFDWNGIPDDGNNYLLTVDLSATPVTIPDTVWMVAQFSTPQSGWVIADEAEIGSTENVIGRGDPWSCGNSVFGHHAGLWANLRCELGVAGGRASSSASLPVQSMVKLGAPASPNVAAWSHRR
ncbi:MAG: hypothetical protein KDA54_05905 [Phycisphaerales bacterium]|nr:hypothetical protein [Phycisphaerales bacterium]